MAYHGIASAGGFSTVTHTIPFSFMQTIKILGSFNFLKLKVHTVNLVFIIVQNVGIPLHRLKNDNPSNEYT